MSVFTNRQSLRNDRGYETAEFTKRPSLQNVRIYETTQTELFPFPDFVFMFIPLAVQVESCLVSFAWNETKRVKQL